MARTNNIPQFDASDTNIGEAPSNGFSPNTTISSAQVNGAIRYSSFAVSALLSAIGSMTNNIGSYEYTGNGETGLNTLKSNLSDDLKSIINQYTFGTAGTFRATETFNYNVIFKGTTNSTDAPRIYFVCPTSSGHHEEVHLTGNAVYGNTFYSITIGCDEYAGQAVSRYFGKLYLKKATTGTDANVTFIDGTYTLKPYYNHHIYVAFTDSSYNQVSMYINATLSSNSEIKTISNLVSLLDASTYVASGVVTSGGSKHPIYLFRSSKTINNCSVFYLDTGESKLNSRYSYTITDEVF